MIIHELCAGLIVASHTLVAHRKITAREGYVSLGGLVRIEESRKLI